MESLIRRLWARVEEQQILLNSALHELYDALGSKSPSRELWTNSWHRDKRRRMD